MRVAKRYSDAVPQIAISLVTSCLPQFRHSFFRTVLLGLCLTQHTNKCRHPQRGHLTPMPSPAFSAVILPP